MTGKPSIKKMDLSQVKYKPMDGEVAYDTGTEKIEEYETAIFNMSKELSQSTEQTKKSVQTNFVHTLSLIFNDLQGYKPLFFLNIHLH